MKNRLEQIAAAIEGGASPDDFRLELDQLLGTEMEERDPIAEATWEDDYRQVQE